jgi:hypothetical protein
MSENDNRGGPVMHAMTEGERHDNTAFQMETAASLGSIKEFNKATTIDQRDSALFHLSTEVLLGGIKMSLEQIAEHLRLLNGSVLTHAKEIAEARDIMASHTRDIAEAKQAMVSHTEKIAAAGLVMTSHANHCPMLHEVADIKQEMALMDARKRVNHVWLKGIWAVAGLILGILGKYLVGLLFKGKGI